MAKITHIKESGERVLIPPSRSRFLKPPAPMTPDESAQVRSAKRQRATYEKKNPDRYKTAASLSPNGMSVGQVYSEMGWGDSGVGPKHYDEQLPGMADPNAAPRPQKWSEMTDEQRSHTTRALALRGTSLEQMTKDFGAQLDQGYMRAHKLSATDESGQTEPYAQRFYSTGEERQKLDQSARDLGIPQVEHATMNAITSPNTKFKTSNGRYPNDEAAVAAHHWAREGHEEELTSANWRASAPERADKGLNARPAMMRKAVHVRKQLDAGVPLAETTGPTGAPTFGEQSPKAGPYANSWSDSHPQFLVSDVHTGGGGMLPHLGYDKPEMRDPEGNIRYEPSGSGKPIRDKSEREKAIGEVPNFHSVSDEAARRALTVRGLGSLREGQAVQWGEEQIQRGAKHGKSEEAAYQRGDYAPPRMDRGHFEQGMLPFGDQ